MDWLGFVGLGILAITNIAVVVYGYGKLTSKVTDLCAHVKDHEQRIRVLEQT